MTPAQTLDWLADQHFDQCKEDRPVQGWIRGMKSQLPAPVQEPVAWNAGVPPLYPEMRDGETISVEYTTPPAQRQWVGLMRGVRVEGETVVISVKCGNKFARQLCAALIEEMNK